MTSLTPAHPADLSLYLSDSNLTQLVSSCGTETTSARSLVELTTASLTAYATASRLGLGLPLRIMVETTSNGPIVLHSFLDPQLHRNPNLALNLAEGTQPLSRSADAAAESDVDDEETVNGANVDKGKRKESTDSTAFGVTGNGEEDEAFLPPLLVATVVAPSYERVGEARRAAAKLETVGLEFQHRWIMDRIQEGEMDGEIESGDHATEDG